MASEEEVLCPSSAVTWLNVRVAPDLTLEELTKRLNETAAAARRKNLNA